MVHEGDSREECGGHKGQARLKSLTFGLIFLLKLICICKRLCAVLDYLLLFPLLLLSVIIAEPFISYFLFFTYSSSCGLPFFFSVRFVLCLASLLLDHLFIFLAFFSLIHAGSIFSNDRTERLRVVVGCNAKVHAGVN